MHALSQLIEQAYDIGYESSRKRARTRALDLVQRLAELYTTPDYGTGATGAERARVHVRAAVIMSGDTPDSTDAEAAAHIPEIVTDLMELLGTVQDRAQTEHATR